MRLTLTPTINEARPPCSSRESTSLPLMSVPSGCPGLPGGSALLRTSPPTGLGSGSTTGPRKQVANSSSTKPPGTHSSRRRRMRAHRIPRSVSAGSVSVAASAVAADASVTAITNPRVEHGVHDIDDEVREDRDGGEDEHARLDHRDVAGERALQHELSHARHGEDLLDDDGAADQRADVEA